MAEPPESPSEQNSGDNNSSRGDRSRQGAANARLVMIMAVIGALLVFTVAALLNWPSAENPPPGLAQKPTTTAPPPDFEAPAGTCLNWTQDDASDISEVPCSEPHLFEMTGTTEVWARFGPDAEFPSTEVFNEIKTKRCADVARQYLRNGFDPNGRYEVSAFLPSKQSWNSGDRTLHCALQQPGPAGQLYRFTGKVDSLDQSDIYDVGTCLGISGSSVSSPVECSKPHSVEMTGVADLSQKFKDGRPATEKQDEFLLTTCQKQLADYAGGKNVAEDKGLSLYWDNISKQSWQAGSRKVNCKVAATLDDGGFAPVTGSVTGEISISDQPAPEKTPQPGVPADGQR